MHHSSRRSGQGNDVVHSQSDIRDNTDRERLKRNANKYQQYLAKEQALAGLSLFSYDPVDYSPSLTRRNWVAPTIPDYSYLLDEARIKTTTRFQSIITIEVILGLFSVIFTLAFRQSFLAAAGIIGFLCCVYALHSDLRRRQNELVKALAAARTVIDARVKEQRETIDRARLHFETMEDTRIDSITRLLSGNPAAVFSQMAELLTLQALPFYLRCTLDLFEHEAVLTLHLPPVSVIPPTVITLRDDGHCDYDDKNAPAINHQYGEALAGTAITLALHLFAGVPTLSALYIRGLSDKWDTPAYVFGLRISRDDLGQLNEWVSGMAAFYSLGAVFDAGPTGSWNPITPPMPSWWGRVPHEKLLTTTVSCPLSG